MTNENPAQPQIEDHAQCQCQCGQWSGEPCSYVGPEGDMLTVEFMPEHLRATHAAAGGIGAWPANGAIRLRVERECAARMRDLDGDWVALS